VDALEVVGLRDRLRLDRAVAGLAASKRAPSSGCFWKYSKTGTPNTWSKLGLPVLMPRSMASQGRVRAGVRPKSTMLRTLPGTSLRSVAPRGVRVKRLPGASATTPGTVKARSRRYMAWGWVRVALASSSEVRVPSLKWSATPSFAKP
jgi:hypothetical protein